MVEEMQNQLARLRCLHHGNPVEVICDEVAAGYYRLHVVVDERAWAARAS